MTYLKPAAEYLIKLYEPTTEATQLKVMSHHEKRWPPKKKSFVVRVNRAKKKPKLKMRTKYPMMTRKSSWVPITVVVLIAVIFGSPRCAR